VWAESEVCSSGQSDLRRTLAGEGVFGEKRILADSGRCSVDVGECGWMSQWNGIV
jgi:hypothetical protein